MRNALVNDLYTRFNCEKYALKLVYFCVEIGIVLKFLQFFENHETKSMPLFFKYFLKKKIKSKFTFHNSVIQNLHAKFNKNKIHHHWYLQIK